MYFSGEYNGFMHNNISYCLSYYDLGGNIKAFYLGGVGGVAKTSSFKNNHNHNSDGILVDTPVKFYSLNVAGVIGTAVAAGAFMAMFGIG